MYKILSENNRAIVDDSGDEVGNFTCEKIAKEVCDYLNLKERIDLIGYDVDQNVDTEYHMNIFKVACVVNNCSLKLAMSQSRVRRAIDTRHMIAWYYHLKLGYTQEKTGFLLNKNHSTVHCSCNVVKNLIETDEDYMRKIELFLEKVHDI